MSHSSKKVGLEHWDKLSTHCGDTQASLTLKRAHQMGYFEDQKLENRINMLMGGVRNLKSMGYRFDWRTKTTIIELLARSGDIQGALRLARETPIETAYVKILPGLLIERINSSTTSPIDYIHDVKLVVSCVRENYDKGLHEMSHATYTSVNKILSEFRLQNTINPRHLWEWVYQECFPSDINSNLAAIASCIQLFPKVQLAHTFVKCYYRGNDFYIPSIHPSYQQLDVKTRFQKYIIALLRVCLSQNNAKGFNNVIGMWQKRHVTSLKIRRMIVMMKSRIGEYENAIDRYRELPQLSTVPANEIIKLCERKIVGSTSTTTDTNVWVKRAENIFNELHMSGLDNFMRPWVSMISLYGVVGHHKKANRLVDRASGLGINIFNPTFVITYATALGIPLVKALELLYPRRKLSPVYRALTDGVIDADWVPPNPRTSNNSTAFGKPQQQQQEEEIDEEQQEDFCD